MTVRVRFAPSPTGSLHLGNARTALFNWLIARRAGGVFVLRVEDTDVDREQEGSEASIFEDLRWLSLSWDEGPDVGGPVGPYRQSERTELYHGAAERLLQEDQAYRCFCSDAELEAERDSQRTAGVAPRYSGRCRRLSREEVLARIRGGEPHAVRFRIVSRSPEPRDLTVSFEDRLRGRVEFPLAEMGDPVILRRDGRPTYNFGVVVDDAAMGISLVLRGDDHLSNTPRQVLLFRALGHPLPGFAHLPMVRGPDGSRLSKRHGATSIAQCRSLGYPPEAVLNALALLGWSPRHDRTLLGLDEMVADFELDRASRAPGIFDPAKLDWISGQHIQAMSEARIGREAVDRLVLAGLLPEDALSRDGEWVEALGRILRGSIARFAQVPGRCSGLFASGGWPTDPDATKALQGESARSVVEALVLKADSHPPLDRDAWRALVDSVRGETGVKGKPLFMPIRVAITGSVSGPELDLLVPLVCVGSRLFPDRIPTISRRAASTLEAWT